LRRHRTLSYYRRPRIRGRAKLEVRISREGRHYTAVGYVRYRNRRERIGFIIASKESGCKYLTVDEARLYFKWVGRGYGHILYWALAKQAIRMGLKGLRSDSYGRNECSDGAWSKIQTHTRGQYSYLKLESQRAA